MNGWTFSGGGGGSGGVTEGDRWQFVDLDPEGSPWILPTAVGLDSDGDPLLRVILNGQSMANGIDFTVVAETGVVTWTSAVVLDDTDTLHAEYSQ